MRPKFSGLTSTKIYHIMVETGPTVAAESPMSSSSSSASDAHNEGQFNLFDGMEPGLTDYDSAERLGATDAYDPMAPLSSTNEVETLPPLDRVLLPEGCARHQAVAVLMKKVRLNEFGLPPSFIRSDLLPSNLGTLTQADVDRASEGLFYYEGFPTLKNGTTFWHQLPYEPYNAYSAFMQFLEQAEDLGIRQLDLLAVQLNLELDSIQAMYHEYHWQPRSRAYDVFQVAADQKRRILRTRKMENKHYEQAGLLLDRLLQRFADPEWIEELNAKEAIEALETLMKVQRVSLGLTGANASSISKNALPAGADTEAIIRGITRNSGLSQQAEGNFVDKLRALTENAEDGMRIQEAILRIGYAGATDQSAFQDQMGLS